MLFSQKVPVGHKGLGTVGVQIAEVAVMKSSDTRISSFLNVPLLVTSVVGKACCGYGFYQSKVSCDLWLFVETFSSSLIRNNFNNLLLTCVANSVRDVWWCFSSSVWILEIVERCFYTDKNRLHGCRRLSVVFVVVGLFCFLKLLGVIFNPSGPSH